MFFHLQYNITAGENRFLRHFLTYFINNALLYHFLANLLSHNKKMTEKSVLREA